MGPFPTIGPSHYWQIQSVKERAIAIAATTVPSTQIRKSIFLAKQISSYVLTLSTTNTSLFYHRVFRKTRLSNKQKIADQHLRNQLLLKRMPATFYPLIVPLSCQNFTRMSIDFYLYFCWPSFTFTSQ